MVENIANRKKIYADPGNHWSAEDIIVHVFESGNSCLGLFKWNFLFCSNKFTTRSTGTWSENRAKRYKSSSVYVSILHCLQLIELVKNDLG